MSALPAWFPKPFEGPPHLDPPRTGGPPPAPPPPPPGQSPPVLSPPPVPYIPPPSSSSAPAKPFDEHFARANRFSYYEEYYG